MTTAILDSEIRYSRITKDYDILIAGAIVASAPNFSAAETIRTQLLSERIQDGCYATAAELDGGEQPPFDRRLIPAADWGTYATNDIATCACGCPAVILLHGVHDTLDIALCYRCHGAYRSMDWPDTIQISAVPDGTEPGDYSDVPAGPGEPKRNPIRTHLAFGHLRRDLFAPVLFCACGERATIVVYGTPDVVVCDRCHAADEEPIRSNDAEDRYRLTFG